MVQQVRIEPGQVRKEAAIQTSAWVYHFLYHGKRAGKARILYADGAGRSAETGAGHFGTGITERNRRRAVDRKNGSSVRPQILPELWYADQRREILFELRSEAVSRLSLLLNSNTIRYMLKLRGRIISRLFR